MFKKISTLLLSILTFISFLPFQRHVKNENLMKYAFIRCRRLFLTCVCVFLLTACSFSDNKIILNTKDFDYSMPKVEELKKADKNDLLKNSIPIDCMMVPLKLTNNNVLIGTEKRIIKSYDIKNKKEEVLYTMKEQSETDTIGILAVSDDYLIFREIVNGNNFKYYVYDFKYKESTLIKESKELSTLVFDEAVIDNDKAYLFLCDKTNDEQGFTYNGYIYDFKSKKLNIFEDKESVSFPCFLNDKLYYLQIDNEELTTELVQFDTDSKEKEILIKGNLKEGYISELKSDGEKLYVFVTREDSKTYCFEYYPDKDEIDPYFAMNSTDGLTVSKRYITWINWDSPDSRLHTMYYIFDTKNNLLYDYEGSEIVQADKQMVWSKFLKDEKDIPKGEIFKKGKVQLMWYPFD